MSNSPSFSYTDLANMALVASFAVKAQQVHFFYSTSSDVCFVLVDQEYIGYFPGDKSFRSSDHSIICYTDTVVKPLYSFEREYIPSYASTVTQFLLSK